MTHFPGIKAIKVQALSVPVIEDKGKEDLFVLNFTEEEIAELQYWRFNHPHPRVMLRMEVLWLKSQGMMHRDIATYAGVSRNTVLNYIRAYQECGIEKLKEIKFYKPVSKLNTYKESLEMYFREHPPASAAAARAKIAELTGITLSVEAVRKFLKGLGMRFLKTGQIPAKVDIAQQEQFLQQKLGPCLEEAKAGKRSVYFVDAAHFVLGAFLGSLWCFVRLFIKTPPGRQRFNVLGALNAVTHELITVTNESYINALSVCELLKKIAEREQGRVCTLVLDNARYQKCKLVQNLAEELHITCLFLPPYSPNLNLIERLWKFVKKKCLYSQYYADFISFKIAISHTLEQTQAEYKAEVNSLCTLKFQTFKTVRNIFSQLESKSSNVSMAESKTGMSFIGAAV